MQIQNIRRVPRAASVVGLLLLVACTLIVQPRAGWCQALIYNGDGAARVIFKTDTVGADQLAPAFGGTIAGEMIASGGYGASGYPKLVAPFSIIQDTNGAAGVGPAGAYSAAHGPSGDFGAVLGGAGSAFVVNQAGMWGVSLGAEVDDLSANGTASVSVVNGRASFHNGGSVVPVSPDSYLAAVHMPYVAAVKPGGVVEVGVFGSLFDKGTGIVVSGLDAAGARPEFATGTYWGAANPYQQSAVSVVQLGPTVYAVDMVYTWRFGAAANENITMDATLTLAADPGSLMRTVDWKHPALPPPGNGVLGVNAAARSALWSNAAGGMTWAATGNWDPNAVPDANTADVVFGGAGAGTVNLGQGRAASNVYFVHPAADSFTLDAAVGAHVLAIGDANQRGAIEVWSGGSDTINANVSNAGTLSLRVADPAGLLTVNGQVAAATLSFTGYGAVKLTNAGNSFATAIDAKSGTAEVAVGPTLGATVSVKNGATLKFTTSTFTNATVAIDAGGELAFAGAGTTTLNGQVTGGGGTLVQRAGTLILSGATKTYAANTEVRGGELRVNTTVAASPGSAFDVYASGVLTGSGTIQRPVRVHAGGTLAPGSSPGVLGTGDLSLASGATYAAQLDGAALSPVALYDQIAVTGTVDLSGDLLGNNGAQLAASLGYVPTPGELLFIIQNDETDPIDTRFQGLPQGAQLDLVSTADGHAYSFRIHYDANAEAGQAAGGNDVALEAVPEPASAALLLAAALTAVLAGLRRIRKARSLV